MAVENPAAKASVDTARLEWLIVGTGAKKAAKVMGSEERGWSVCDCSNGLVFMSRNHLSWRGAIDSAMERFP